jgi:DNA-binding CsgD family transcriptional regulator
MLTRGPETLGLVLAKAQRRKELSFLLVRAVHDSRDAASARGRDPTDVFRRRLERPGRLAHDRSDVFLHEEILRAASEAGTLDRFRDAALALARDTIGADVGLFATVHAHGAARSAFGFDASMLRCLERRWDAFGREIAPMYAEAERSGATTDVRTFGASLSRTQLHRELIAPAGGSESLFVAPSFGGRKLGLFMLGRVGGRRFTDAEVGLGRSIAAALGVSCAALPPAAAELSPLEAELMRYLELGYTSHEIALARGKSFYTVRNQLSALYKKLGVANRTEAVGLRRP